MGKNKRSSARKGKSKGKGKGKAWQSSINDASDDGEALLDEEITALSAIFQNDFSIVADHPIKELTINLRPHSEDDSEFSAHLFVRCFPGYPWKPPKLQIVTSDKSLEIESQTLLAMLVEQAASCSREGRVMVFNLVEAAQEYFSECLASLSHRQVQENIVQISEPSIPTDSTPPEHMNTDFVYFDLWEHSGSWEGPDASAALDQEISPSSNGNRGDSGVSRRPSALVLPELKPRDIEKSSKALHVSENQALDTLQEQDGELSSKNAAVTEFMQMIYKVGQPLKEQGGMTSDIVEVSPSLEDDPSFLIEKDMILAYLLRLVCGKKGPLPNILSELTSQLLKLGIIPTWAGDLVLSQSQMFRAMFKHVFKHNIDKDNVSEFKKNLERFWNASPDLLGESNIGTSNSRYQSDFEELCLLGKGGFGHVVLCKNKLDGRRYAVKKVRLKDENPSDKILREVATLSRLQHQHVVRYYQAWFETAVVGASGTAYNEESEASSSWIDASVSNNSDSTISTFLYIQMEYCPRTLKEVFETQSVLDKDLVWGIFRQIVEGLAHIHGQGIIHRDLTPSNIFFDTRNDVKIGDFGLAKFANLENPEQDYRAPINFETNMKSLEGTGQVGTYFYRAPEIEQAWPHIDEKVDMYSLGVILFELWHPFSTGMERYVTLNELKQHSILPSEWVARFPQQAALVRLLVSSHPHNRPSARDVLQSELLPPRMEDEALKDILRTIQTADNSFVFDQIISAIFDEERLALKSDSGATGLGLSSEDLDLHSSKWLKAQEMVHDLTKEVFTRHGAHKFQSSSMTIAIDAKTLNRSSVKVINSSGSMLELRHDTRYAFARWAVLKQCASWKRYEISHVYRKGVGYRAPKEHLQGEFDIVGGFRALAEAETIKAVIEIISKVCSTGICELRLNHHGILDTIWSWSGVTTQLRKNVAQILGTMTFLRPQSTERKAKWAFVRRQLLQGLHLSEAVVDRLQTAERRFTGNADEVLARLRGALSNSPSSIEAIEELSRLLSYLRVWRVEMLLTVDVFMVPANYYFQATFFQIYLPKVSSHSILLAVGGRYDVLLEKFSKDYGAISPPGATGVTVALQKLIYLATKESKNDPQQAKVLVCCRGGGGLLKERMEVANELWSANIEADFVCAIAPSLTEQYEYAHENGIKLLVIITEAGLSQSGLVKVRHLDFKTDVDVPRESLGKYIAELSSGPLTARKIRQSLS